MTDDTINPDPIPKIGADKVPERLALAEMTKRPLILRGRAGVGKSSIFQSYARRRNMAEEDGYGYIDTRVLYLDPVDVKGFPSIDLEAGVSRWLPNEMFPLEKNVESGHVPKKGLWVLEELPSGQPAIQAALYQPTLDREINGEKVADGWTIVATGNRLDDRGVVNRMPSPLVSRFWHEELTISVKDWSLWGIGEDAKEEPLPVPDFDPEQRVISELIAFFRWRPDLLHTFDPETWVQDTPYSCPRSVEILSNLLEAYRKLDPVHKYPVDVVKAAIGDSVGREFWGFMDLVMELPTIDEILMNPKDAAVPEEPCQMFAVCAMIARHITPKNSVRAFDYIGRMTKEYQTVTIRDIMHTNDEVMQTESFTQWAIKNAEAMGGHSEYDA